jgi:ribosomal protein L12E/L44/L45/RPP1/RPP2
MDYTYVTVEFDRADVDVLRAFAVLNDVNVEEVIRRCVRFAGSVAALNQFDGFKGKQDDPREGTIW